MRPEVLKAEDDLAGSRPAEFRLLQLLDLDHQLALPRIAERCACGGVFMVGETCAEARAGFDDDRGKTADRGRRERHAALAVLYLPRNADTHSDTSPGPR